MAENGERRIGVFICHCGGNISDYVGVKDVAEAVANEPGVVVSKNHMFTCSDAAQQEMLEDIEKLKLDGLVIASCSPKLHMFTFRGMAERGGMNPYQYVHVNLREQCSWAHRNEHDEATQKGIELVRAGIAKCRLTEPLSPLRIETVPKALVIGAGVAGLRAALALSDLGLHVYLIEKAETVGGWTGHWKKLFPDNRDGAKIVGGLLRTIQERQSITLFTRAELVEKSGTVGDFTVKIEIGGAETVELNVGAIVVSTGFETYQPIEGEYGYGLEGVVTLSEFKQMVEAGSGRLHYKGKAVSSIVYVYCVGSRQSEGEACPHPNQYCSRYCCTAAVHTAACAQTDYPGLHQYHLYRDMRTYGRNELLYEEARRNGSVFLRFDAENPPVVERSEGGLLVRVKDELTRGDEIEIPADLVVLVTGMVPRDHARLVDVLKLPESKEGFFNEIHLKLRPVETVIDGVFIAGASQGPKTMAEAVGSALAAVSKSAALLMKGYVDLEPLVAKVDTSRCTWCGECQKACPYGAVERIQCDGKEVATIIPALCKGEGGCVPVCPYGAIDVEGYTDAQITAMIDAFGKEVA